MDNNEQLYSEEAYEKKDYGAEEQGQSHSIAEEYDYNREPPLDSATTRDNRSRSKYVFTTLCFLLALILLYSYINGGAGASSSGWFPLFGAVALAIMGVVFLRSPDSPPEQKVPVVSLAYPPVSEENTQEKVLDPFEKLVQEALSSIPDEFHKQMDNIVVHVAYEPGEAVLERVGIKDGYLLLGLYEGIPLTSYGRAHSSYPEVITIYQHAIEDYCGHNPERIRQQVRSTVLHEVAHHFGMGHEEMPIWIK